MKELMLNEDLLGANILFAEEWLFTGEITIFQLTEIRGACIFTGEITIYQLTKTRGAFYSNGVILKPISCLCYYLFQCFPVLAAFVIKYWKTRKLTHFSPLLHFT